MIISTAITIKVVRNKCSIYPVPNASYCMMVFNTSISIYTREWQMKGSDGMLCIHAINEADCVYWRMSRSQLSIVTEAADM